MSQRRLGWSAVFVLSLGAACKEVVAPELDPCGLENSRVVALGVGQYVSVVPDSSQGCIAIGANTGLEAEYMIVPTLATGVPGRRINFVLHSGSGAAAAPIIASRPAIAGKAARFHDFLRRGEASHSWGALRPSVQPSLSPPLSPSLQSTRVPKPKVGDRATYRVCSTSFCATTTPVGAVARSVGERVAIFVDTLAPPGLNDDDLDTIRTVFDNRLHGLATSAFGNESDINQDSVVIVLMTPIVNQFVSAQECVDQGFVSGFFLGADIDPFFANDPRINRSEIFYSFVADAAGALSCPHSRDVVKRLLPVTFIHEFQHMISFNQHALVRTGDPEELWLNEAMSHYAEELGGRSFLAEADSITFGRYMSGDLYNAYHYLETPGAHYVLPGAGIGSLEERGAGWLFVRYLVDRYANNTNPGTRDQFTRSLTATTRTGAANVEFVTGRPFAEVLTRWALTNWTDNITDVMPLFPAPPELQYDSWNFRSVYQQRLTANAQWCRPPAGEDCKAFPLEPVVIDPTNFNLSTTLYAGSAMYLQGVHPAGAPPLIFTFRAPDGWMLEPTYAPRLTILRIR